MSVGTGSLKRTAKSVAAPKEETVMPQAKQAVEETETAMAKENETAKTKKTGTRNSSAKTSTAKKSTARTAAAETTASKTVAKKSAAPKTEVEAVPVVETTVAAPSEQEELTSGIKCDIPVYLL